MFIISLININRYYLQSMIICYKQFIYLITDNKINRDDDSVFQP
jgi:hypothetical protein